ncbi:MAG: hypothetical protein R2856_27045 [Caldilineaceae bacterium]
MTLSLPAGNYSFRADITTVDGKRYQYFSGGSSSVDNCLVTLGGTIPGCGAVHGDDARLRRCDGRSARQQPRWCRTCLSTSSAAARTSTPAATPAALDRSRWPARRRLLLPPTSTPTGGANCQYFSGGSAGTNTCHSRLRR